jgi:uncharacterized membrane protein YhhN
MRPYLAETNAELGIQNSEFESRILFSFKIPPMLKPLEYLFFIVAAVEIFAEVTQNSTVRFIAKPLLMIVLIAFYMQAVGDKWNKVHKLMRVAFFFSWIGDVALMFVFKNENFFLVGLVGFLITHILYTIAFADVTNKNATPILPKKFWIVVPLVIYMAAFLSLLVPAINGDEKTQPFLVPVLVYSTAIATMVVFAINRYGRVNEKSFALVFGGALLFMFSDSIIAINKFLHPFELAGICIMVLYIAGQYLIAKGTLAQFSGTKN